MQVTSSTLATRLMVACALFFAFCVNLVQAATPAGTTITNTAQVRFQVEGASLVVQATHQINTDLNTASDLKILHFVGPSVSNARTLNVTASQCYRAGLLQTSPAPVLLYAPLFSGSGPVSYVEGASFKGGDSMLISLTDFGKNRDPQSAETVIVQVSSRTDSERVVLTETGPSTGVFAGYLQTVRSTGVSSDCQLNVGNNDEILVRYLDADNNVLSQSLALVDPLGRVFDAVTGALVNGARVSLINNATGLPAEVYADDGVTRYPSSVLTGSTVSDAAGGVTVLAAGQYRFPFVAVGSYRLVVEPPEGYRFPSAINPDSTPILKDATWRVGSGSRGESFAVQFGPPVELDVPLDPRAGKLELVKAVGRNSAGFGDSILYTVDLRNSDLTTISGIRVIDDIPAGMRYRPGSARLITASSPRGEKIADPSVSERAQRLQFELAGTAGMGPLGSLAPRAQARLTYVLQVTAATAPGRQTNTAFASYPGAVSNTASASLMVVDELMSTSGILIGRVWSQCDRSGGKGVAGVRVQMEDGRFAISDSTGAWHLEGVRAGGHVVQLDRQSLPVGAQVKQCGKALASASSALVYLRPGTVRRVDFVVSTSDAATDLTSPARSAALPKRSSGADTSAPPLDAAFWASATPQNEFVFPRPDFLPMTPALGVSFKHSEQERVELFVNEAKVSAFHFDGTKTSRGVAVSFWRAIPLIEGENRLLARVYGAGNVLIRELAQIVEMPGIPVRAQVLSARSVLVADGNHPIRVALQLFDARGKPARRGLVGPYEVRGNYLALQHSGDQLRDPLSGTAGNAGLSPQEFVIAEQGLIEVVLQPASNAGELVLRFPSFESPSERDVRLWVNAAQRDWIVVGFAEGTWAERRIRQSMKAVAGAPGMEADLNDGRAALYARGSIPGGLLLTIAYDTRGKQGGADRNLAQALKPDENYLVYGDESSVQRDGVSSRKLYLRIERNQFYAMFGDFSAGLTVNEIARFDRVLNGVKTQSRFSLGAVPLELTGFVARTGQRAVRDEIATDGTSGAYRLSQRFLEPGTDRLRLQVRSLFPANELIEERMLQRFVDYRIDYYSGEVILAGFARPLSWGGNRVVLVAEYETAPTARSDWVAGARLGARFESTVIGTADLGVTALHDGTDGRRGQVLGVDANLVIDQNNRVKLELANSRGSALEPVSGVVQASRGAAYSAEYLHKSAQTEARVFARHSDLLFGIKSQNSLEPGTTRAGAQVRQRINEETSAIADAQWTETPSGQLSSVEARLEQQYRPWGWFAGMRSNRGVSQNQADESTQATLGVNVRSEDRRLGLRAESATTVAGSAFGGAPDRYLVGWDYAVTPQTSVLLEQLWLRSSSDSAQLSRAGVRFTPEWGGEWSAGIGRASSSLPGSAAAGETRPLMSLGYQQRWALNERWSTTLGLQRQRWIGSDALLQPQASAAGTASATALDNYSSATLALQYSKDEWSMATSLEGRWGQQLSRHSVGFSAYRKQSAGVAMAAGLTLRDVNEAGQTSREINARYAQAWREPASPWSVLQRLDWTGTRQEGSTTPLQLAQKVVNNLHVNYLKRDVGEVSLHHGIKYVNETLQDSPYKGFTNFLMLEARKGLMPRLDAGVHVFGAHTAASRVASRGYGFDLGFAVTEGAKVTVGFNRRGLRDGIYSEANWSKAGLYVRLQMRFDETSFRSNADATLAR